MGNAVVVIGSHLATEMELVIGLSVGGIDFALHLIYVSITSFEFLKSRLHLLNF